MTISDVLKNLILKIEESDVSAPNIVFANIATLSDDDSIVTEKSTVILSVVNIEEDKTLKNQSLYKTPDANSIERYKKPAQNLIFSILLSAYNKDNTMYDSSISKLEIAIRYLQSHNVFYYNGINFIEQSQATTEQTETYNKIILDLVSLKNDQVNQLWTYLGSKYMPSALYTLRLIRIQEDIMITEKIVKQVKIELWNNDKNDITGEIETTADIELKQK